MCNKVELNQITEKMIKAYHDSYGKKLVKIYMYGSYARGDYKQDSDIDFVALVEGERQEVQMHLDEIWSVSCNLSMDYDTIISPVAIPYHEFISLKDILPYYENIYKEGIEVSA